MQTALAWADDVTAKFAWPDYAIVGAYLLGMLALGGWLSTRIKAFKDYFLAGGALTTPLLICTLVSTYFGLDVTFGTSESGFYYGISAWLWYSAPYYVFILIAALLLAKRLRRFQFMTLPDLLEHHYGMPARVVGAVACMVYSMPILAMYGMMTILRQLGIEQPYVALAIALGVCAAYTIMGGLWADAISDTVQFVLMCATLAFVIPMSVDFVGGYGFTSELPAEHLSATGGLSLWMLAAWAMTGLTVLVEPAFYQRVFAAKDDKSIVRALVLGIVLWAAYDWGVVIIGMVAQAAVAQGKDGFTEELTGDAALLQVCMTMLPVGLRGLFIGGVLAAAMSSIDSYSLLASGNLTYDIAQPLSGGRWSERMLIRTTRIGVFVVIAASALAALQFSRMRDAWLFMASILTATVLVPVLAAVFLPRVKRLAGVLGASAGLAGLVAFYVVLFKRGTYDAEEETHVLRLGVVELWQDAAALVAIPISAIGFAVGQVLGRRRS